MIHQELITDIAKALKEEYSEINFHLKQCTVAYYKTKCTE